MTTADLADYGQGKLVHEDPKVDLLEQNERDAGSHED